MSDEQKSVEISNPTLGSLKIFGTDTNTMFTILACVGSFTAAILLYTHMVEAKEVGKETAQALKENNKEVALVLKETQKEVTQILREMARATREQNCLLSQPQDRRVVMADTCKRISN